jgi:ribosomal protein S27E
LLLEAYPKVLKKSNVADSLGSIYRLKKKDLSKAVEWYVRSVAAAGAHPSDWSPYLYLSGIYRYFGLNQIASGLQAIANEVRKNPIDLTSDYFKGLENAKAQMSIDSARSLYKLLNEDFTRIVSQAIKAFRERDRPPAEGSVHRPDLKCKLCGNADVVFRFSDDHTHERCVKCGAIFCKTCRVKSGPGCPVCGANELSIDFIRNPPEKK